MVRGSGPSVGKECGGTAAEGDALMAETDARWRRRDADGKWEVP